MPYSTMPKAVLIVFALAGIRDAGNGRTVDNLKRASREIDLLGSK